MAFQPGDRVIATRAFLRPDGELTIVDGRLYVVAEAIEGWLRLEGDGSGGWFDARHFASERPLARPSSGLRLRSPARAGEGVSP